MAHPGNYPQSARHLGSVLLAGALLSAPGPARPGEYVVRVDTGLSTLDVHACFDRPVPEAVRPLTRDARAHLEWLRVDGRELRVGANGRVRLGAGEQSCVEYAIDVRSAAGTRRFAELDLRGTVLLEADQWLWLPDRAHGAAQQLRFELPEAMQVSVPWPSAGEHRFRIDASMQEGSALVAIGRMHTERIAVPGAELRLSLLPGSPPVDENLVRDWVRNGARAVATIYGRFPVPAPQVLVVPVGRGGEAVPWGQVQRGGGAAAHLFIDQTRPAAEFTEDWVLVHELGHLVHPNLGRDSAWLSEGLATYYQYVARTRAGMLTEQEAWQKLHEGFERGRAQTRDGVDLVAATRVMHAQRIFMRVYWTGTAIALLADLALRDGGSSLDAVLADFRDCCLAEPRVWETGEFLERLDRAGGSAVLSDLARRYVHSDRFPDLREAYDRLGLRVTNGRIELDPDSTSASLRRAIMAPGI